MITVMVLLCYVNLSGMSLECIVANCIIHYYVGCQECVDYVDVLQLGSAIGSDRLAIIPRLNFTCSGRITSIRARMRVVNNGTNYPFFQVWRPASVGSTIYNKVGEVQLQSDDLLSEVSDATQIATLFLTGNNTIAIQPDDVVGYYHPPQSRYQVRASLTDGYIIYEFGGSSQLVDLNNHVDTDDNRRPLIQFTIGKCVINQAQ